MSAVKEFRAPKTSEEVRSFLGLVNYVGKFIPNLVTTAEQLSKLTRKAIHFDWRSKPCARIERWVIRLQSYKFKTIFKPGKTNIADPLSRLIPETAVEVNAMNDDSEAYINWIVMHSIPKAIKSEQIASASLVDNGIQAVKRAIDSGDRSDKVTAPFKNFESEFCFADDILLRGTRIVIPECFYDRTLELAHEGHPGTSMMKRRLRAKVWWPKIDDHVESYVKKCKGCTLVGAPSAPEPMSRKVLPSVPWEHLAIDFLGPLPSGHYLFVVVDYYSRYKEVEIMTNTEAVPTVRLRRIFARFGLPLSIHSDNGPQFISQEFENYCKNNNIHHNTGIPYWRSGTAKSIFAETS